MPTPAVRLLICLVLMTGAFADLARRVTPVSAAANTIPVVADSYIDRDHPNQRYGAEKELRVDGADAEIDSLLAFDVPAASSRIRIARLRLFATTDTAARPEVTRIAGEWNEATLTWNGKPQTSGDPVQDQGAVHGGTWIDIDVTKLVTAGARNGFLLTTASSDGVRFSSREGDHPPVLEMLLEGADGPGHVVVAVGDIACDPNSGAFHKFKGTQTQCRQQYIADLIGKIGPEAFLGLGDFQYEDGTLAKIMASYDVSFGRFKDITYPTAGPTHDTEGRGDYYTYWGTRAGPSPDQTWYSFDIGSWHIISLNLNCKAEIVGGCAPGSREYEWLKADLAASKAGCTIAFWHQPRYSSGNRHGDDPEADNMWDLLYASGAELVLSGHEHNYERFAPLDDKSERSPEYGMVQFVVGTGGKNLYAVTKPENGSEVINDHTFGVLKLTLYDTSYDWSFVAEDGSETIDSGSAFCHDAPATPAS